MIWASVVLEVRNLFAVHCNFLIRQSAQLYLGPELTGESEEVEGSENSSAMLINMCKGKEPTNEGKVSKIAINSRSQSHGLVHLVE